MDWSEKGCATQCQTCHTSTCSVRGDFSNMIEKRADRPMSNLFTDFFSSVFPCHLLS
jgi:hypothetical protein